MALTQQSVITRWKVVLSANRSWVFCPWIRLTAQFMDWFYPLASRPTIRFYSCLLINRNACYISGMGIAKSDLGVQRWGPLAIPNGSWNSPIFLSPEGPSSTVLHKDVLNRVSSAHFILQMATRTSAWLYAFPERGKWELSTIWEFKKLDLHDGFGVLGQAVQRAGVKGSVHLCQMAYNSHAWYIYTEWEYITKWSIK